MAGTGPPPNPNARRGHAVGWTTLPAAGRESDPPPWPLPRPTDAELARWAALWAKPQAVMWDSVVDIVARYCRVSILADEADAGTRQMNEARLLGESLGLSPMALKKLQWNIGKPDDAATNVSNVARMEDFKTRLGSG